MKVLSSAQMREVDRRTMELGIPGIILMENAGHRVVEFLAEGFAPLASQRIAVLCGKGNNGGDGLVIARQLFTRVRPKALDVLLAAPPEELRGDAAVNFRMLAACGCPVSREIHPSMRAATVVVDALLGTGLKGPAAGRMLELIREINTGFPAASIVAVDIPSGMDSDTGTIAGETVRADYTVTLAAPKIGLVMPPGCDRAGVLRVAPIGTPPELLEEDSSLWLSLSSPDDFRGFFRPRPRGAHKGDFGRILVVGGSRGKTGAAAMAGMAALRAGAGLVTVATGESALPAVAAHCPELMTEPLPETEAGSISMRAFDYGRMEALLAACDLLAVGPGLGNHPDTVQFLRRLAVEFQGPAVIDADGLNALAGAEFAGGGRTRVLTPHPGEMARLTGTSAAEVQRDRIAAARSYATGRGVTLVLKGQRTLTAAADGRVWINPTGTPAMATGGSGDILTGMIAAFLAQFPREPHRAVTAAVYLHGRAAELAAAKWGEQAMIATDLLQYLPEAMHECAGIPDRV